jgi:hypothetical protein
MRPTRLLLILLLIIISAIGLISGPGCANIIPPAGGPRDSVSPLLLKASPVDSSLNFKPNRISFTFDEFVEVQNVQQEVLVSPLPKLIPAVDYKLNTITVRLKDSLDPNTTYTINFGSAIKDINEGNILKDFTYTFSTGSYIDSLQFSGKVLLAETGKTDSTLIVMLHSSQDDSAVSKEKPRYIAKLDSKGNFVFKNLPPKTYRVYALEDAGNTRTYQKDNQLFAFADSAITISSSVKPLVLYAYASPDKTTAAVPPLNLGGRNPRGVNTSTDRRLKFSTNLVNSHQDLLGDFIMSFEQPLRSFDSSKVGFFSDSAFNPVTGWRITKDSTNRKLQLTHTWKENTTYHLILDKDFAEDSTGKKLLRTDTLSFQTKKIADYGQIKIKLRNVDLTQNPVLQFVLNNTITQSFPMNGSIDFAKNLFLPGDYELRVLYDTNKNGKWDPGQFFGKHQQPELVKPIDRRIVVKPNWENEFEIAL